MNTMGAANNFFMIIDDDDFPNAIDVEANEFTPIEEAKPEPEEEETENYFIKEKS